MEQITENPYLQYFIGLSGYQEEALFDASTLVLFRKRITAEMLMEANEYLLAHKDDSRNDNPLHLPEVQARQMFQKKTGTKGRWHWMRPVRRSTSVTRSVTLEGISSIWMSL